MGRFIMLSGPSCAGKGPLFRAFNILYPQATQSIKKVVLYNDRNPRPGETDGVDYHFVKDIQHLPEEQYLKLEIRPGNWQALKIDDVVEVLRSNKIGFLEVFHKLGVEARKHTSLSSLLEKGEVCTVFLSPLSAEDIQFVKIKGADLKAFVADVMRRKLLRRTARQKGILSLKDLDDVEKRCSTAYEELQSASHYNYIIVNHDGEDSDNWEQFPHPIGDARKSVEAFLEIVEGKKPAGCQPWPLNLLL